MGQFVTSRQQGTEAQARALTSARLRGLPSRLPGAKAIVDSHAPNVHMTPSKLCHAKHEGRHAISRDVEATEGMESLEKACGQHAIHKAFRYQVLCSMGREETNEEKRMNRRGAENAEERENTER